MLVFSRARNRLCSLLFTVALILTPSFYASTAIAETMTLTPSVAASNLSTNLFPIPEIVGVLGDRLIFRTGKLTEDQRLWATDGVSTVLLRRGIKEASIPLVVYNGIGFFSAYEEGTGSELWRTDGTPQGTYRVKDINPGVFGSSPWNFVDFKGSLFFTADSGNATGFFWKSDGTAEGTELALTKNIYPRIVASVGGKLFFINEGPSGPETETTLQLWVSDGTDAGTALLKEFSTQETRAAAFSSPTPGIFFFNPLLTDVNGTLFFRANDRVHGTELWKSDGTVTGTVLVADLNPGVTGSMPNALLNFQNTLFFANSAGLWKSDGTPSGTLLVKAGITEITSLYAGGNIFYFAATTAEQGMELWRSDGTPEGTQLVRDIHPGAASSAPTNFATFNGKLVFAASDGDSAHGTELWHSDGTAGGTVLIKDIYPGTISAEPGTFAFSSNPSQVVSANGRLFFQTADNWSRNELWYSDGSEAGTRVIDEIPVTEYGLLLDTPILFGASAGGIGQIPVDFGNLSSTLQTTTTLTVTLDEHLMYLGSTSTVTPTVTATTLVWTLPDKGVVNKAAIRVQLPADPLGTRYPVTFTLAVVNADNLVADEVSRTIEVMVADQNYLPIIGR